MESIFGEPRHYAMEMMNATLYLLSTIKMRNSQERRQNKWQNKLSKHL